jgi:phosphatidate cytidylyltransferase
MAPHRGNRLAAPESRLVNDGLAYLFSTRGVFDQPATRIITGLIVAAFVLAPLATIVLSALGKLSDNTRRDVWVRYRTWLIITPAMVVPILICPATAMLIVTIASILCYREYARATGLFRHRSLSAVVVLGIICVGLTCLDNWYGMFAAITPLTIVILAAAAVLVDSPHGYVQRVALACVAFLLFGMGLGHLGYMANEPNYRPIMLLILVAVQLNDIFAYVCGKTFGRRKLFPNTSPNKTLGGHVGAIVLTTTFTALVGHIVFEGTRLDTPLLLILLGLIISIGGQMGDLVLSSIKRDLGIKDMAATLPGHGGFLDRFNSVLLVAPATFHFIGYFLGFGLSRPARVISAHLFQ